MEITVKQHTDPNREYKIVSVTMQTDWDGAMRVTGRILDVAKACEYNNRYLYKLLNRMKDTWAVL